VFGFGVSANPQTYFGKHRWLFYTGEKSLENHRGALPFTPDELQVWARTLERKRELLETLGSRYLYVIAPDKESVYSELLPDWMRAIGPTRREQFLAYMRENAPKVEILDLTDTLIAAKRFDGSGEYVYGDLGTHWTGRGSMVALKAVLERLDQLHGGFTPEDVDAFEPIRIADHGDSGATRMYIGDLLPQRTDVYKPPQVLSQIRFEGSFRVGRIRRSDIPDSQRPRVMMLHDSFGPHVEVGLSEQCSYLECRWDNTVDVGDVVAADPDVFVDLYVERMLNHLDPHKLMPRDEFPWRTRFEQSQTTLIALDTTREDWGVQPFAQATVGPAVTGRNPRLPVVMTTPSDRLAFADLVPVEGEVPVLHIVLDSPCGTELVLYFKPPGAPSFLRRNSYRKRLKPGTNEFYLPLDRQGTAGELLLRPGQQAGAYLLREFAIRSVRAS